MVTKIEWLKTPNIYLVTIPWVRNVCSIQLGWLISVPCGVIFAHSCFCGQLVVNGLTYMSGCW